MNPPPSDDTHYMLQAITEAHKCTPSEGAYSVGAVIIKDGQVVSTGYSRELEGNTHAEECALLKLNDHDMSKGADLYTTMEPCSKRLSGKESCTERLIKAGISRVIIGVREPPNFVTCQGTDILTRTGIRITHLKELESQCLAPNSHIVSKV